MDNFDLKKYLAEGRLLKENESLPTSTPELPDSPLKEFLQSQIPEEIEGSWDYDNDTFTAPFEYKELVNDDIEEIEENLKDIGHTLDDLPTQWVKINQYGDTHNNETFYFNDYVKYIPGKGIMVGITTNK